MKFKLTKLEKNWVLYDVGNSAFTMMVSTIFPIYFNTLAGNAGISDVDYLACLLYTSYGEDPDDKEAWYNWTDGPGIYEVTE